MDAHEYFKQYEGYFWEIQEDEGHFVFVIRGGGTIVYVRRLMEWLNDLSIQGLPPLGALLLVAVATTQAPEEQLDGIEKLIRSLISGWEMEEMMRVNATINEAFGLLRILAALPREYTAGNRRVQFFQLLFSNSHHQLTAHQSREVMKAAGSRSFVDKHVKMMGSQGPPPITRARFAKDIRSIALLGRRFPSVESIIDQLAAIPPLPEAPVIEEEPAPMAGDLVDLLIEHPLTFQVGTLIKPIWSGLNIPMHHQLPGDQPLGGFSDLSNKGDFDKLLISEFANEELLLLSRLANNEALFLHREIPPGKDDLQRVVLVDISLKSWGNPKILAYAVMVAIARHPRTDIHSAVFAVGEELHPLHLGTVNEVIASQQLLEGCLHPAAGLTKFFERQPAGVKLEIIFIAPPDTLAQPAVKKVISDHYGAFKYWIEVGRVGEIDLYKNQNNSRKLIQQMRLPVESIWKSYKRVRSAEDVRAVISAPVISPRKAAAPLLYPPSIYKAYMVAEDMEIYCIDRLGKLFRLWQEKDKVSGFELLFEGLPDGATDFQIGEVAKTGHRLLLCYHAGTGEMELFDIETGKKTVIDLHGRKGKIVSELFFFQGAFYFQGREDYNKIINGTAVHFNSLGLMGQEKYETGLKEHQGRLSKVGRLLRFNKFSILKNLDTVGINKAGNLVFNKHELVCREAGHIVLVQRKSKESQEIVCEAVWDESAFVWVFTSGNRVRVDRSGMLILEWRTDRNPAPMDVLMTSRGANPINVVKVLKEYANIDLADGQRIIDAGRATVVSGIDRDSAVQLRDRLTNAGAVAEVVPSPREIYIPAALDTSLGVATASEFAGNEYYYRSAQDRRMRTLGGNEFFKKNIRSFIQDILQWNSR